MDRQDLQLHSVFPAFGPQSGGTLLSITGYHLNMGSNVSAYLDELACLVNSSHATGTRLLCTTTRANAPRTVSQLTVYIDGAKRVLTRSPFSFTKDPTVMEIKPLRSFASGGRMLSVHGTNLDSIQKPQMVVYMDDGITIANVSVRLGLRPATPLSKVPHPPPSPHRIRKLDSSRQPLT